MLEARKRAIDDLSDYESPDDQIDDHYMKLSELNIKKKKYNLELWLELNPGAKEAYIRNLIKKAKKLKLGGPEEPKTPECILKLQGLIRKHMKTDFEMAARDPREIQYMNLL